MTLMLYSSGQKEGKPADTPGCWHGLVLDQHVPLVKGRVACGRPGYLRGTWDTCSCGEIAVSHISVLVVADAGVLAFRAGGGCTSVAVPLVTVVAVGVIIVLRLAGTLVAVGRSADGDQDILCTIVTEAFQTSL